MQKPTEEHTFSRGLLCKHGRSCGHPRGPLGGSSCLGVSSGGRLGSTLCITRIELWEYYISDDANCKQPDSTGIAGRERKNEKYPVRRAFNHTAFGSFYRSFFTPRSPPPTAPDPQTARWKDTARPYPAGRPRSFCPRFRGALRAAPPPIAPLRWKCRRAVPRSSRFRG